MQSFLRLMMFAIFGVGGVAAAIGFALWSDPEADASQARDDRQSLVKASAQQTLSTTEQALHQQVSPVVVDAVSADEEATIPAVPGISLAAGEDVSESLADSSPGGAGLDLPASDDPAHVSAAPLVGQEVTSDEAAQAAESLPTDLGSALKILNGLQQQAAATPETQQQTQAKQVPLPPPPVEPGIQESASGELTVAGPEASFDEDGRFQLNTKPDADLRQVLDLLSQKSGLNIIASNSVQGTVSASLNDVDTMTALDAILKSTGYVAYQEGDILFVGTPDEYRQRKHRVQAIDTRIYRPNYVTATELQQLISPLLTPEVGAISISSAAEAGIQSNNTEVGGDSFTGNEVLLVRDYENVLKQVDQVYHEVDRQPDQVAIEAMILSVSLTDETDLGVDFELLKNKANLRLISGSPPADLGAIVADGGLKVGFLDSSTTIFVEALESIGDTNVIATPRLLVLNKQRAEILIGSELGYVSTTVTETAVTQAVEFLEVGTQLRIRPFIGSDGMVRMEVHPELSTGSVRVESGFTLPDKEVTEVTTNIMARDGSTVVIGGLMREDLQNDVTQIPLLGSLPFVGPLFRQTSESTEKREIIVLITPRIIRNKELDCEGNKGATEFHHRQAIVAEKMTRLSRLSVSRHYLFRARDAWAKGKPHRAMKYVNWAIHYNPQSREAIDLRADIYNGVPIGDHTGQAPYIPPPGPYSPHGPLDGEDIAPWVLDELGGGIPPDGELIPPGQPSVNLEPSSP